MGRLPARRCHRTRCGRPRQARGAGWPVRWSSCRCPIRPPAPASARGRWRGSRPARRANAVRAARPSGRRGCEASNTTCRSSTRRSGSSAGGRGRDRWSSAARGPTLTGGRAPGRPVSEPAPGAPQRGRALRRGPRRVEPWRVSCRDRPRSGPGSRPRPPCSGRAPPQCDRCPDCSNSTHSDCGMRSAMSSICIGVASSWRPLVSSTGPRRRPGACMISQSRSVPTTWNSVGPFIVRYTCGLRASLANERWSNSGAGTTRQRCRS